MRTRTDHFRIPECTLHAAEVDVFDEFDWTACTWLGRARTPAV